MIDVILLAAGSSVRMKTEKALLPFAFQETFLSHILSTYLKIDGLDITIVVNPKNYKRLLQEQCTQHKRIKIIINSSAEKGRLSSIALGLEKVKKDHGVIIQNIDNPFVTPDIIKGMIKMYRDDTYVVPQHQNMNGHPLLLGSQLVNALKETANQLGDFKSFLKEKTPVFYKTYDAAIMANINSADEYFKWFGKEI